MRPLCQLQIPSHVLRNRLLPRVAIPVFPRPPTERVSCLSTVNSGPDPHTSRTSETNGESHAPDTQGTAKEAEEMQVPLSACVLAAVVVLGCGLPAAYFVGRALEKDTTSYRHLKRKRKKRDAAWRELQKIDENVFDVPRIAKVHVNERYVTVTGHSNWIEQVKMLGEEQRDRADRKVQMEKEKAEEEKQYRIWQERAKIDIPRYWNPSA